MNSLKWLVFLLSSGSGLGKHEHCSVGTMTRMALLVTEDYSEAEPVPEEVNAVAEQLLAVWQMPGVV